MARKRSKVYLGYEDDSVNEKNHLLNYTVNKIGGYPDWPPSQKKQQCPKCHLCGLHRVLVVQCYAPIESSVFHRILYVFACINPNCWIQSESWLCLRVQYEDTISMTKNTSATVLLPSETDQSWCQGADEWDGDDNGDTANGNVMNVEMLPPNDALQRLSDEDESNSFEVETVEQALGNLQMYDAHNANMSPMQGAVGAMRGPSAGAELEGDDEPGLVSVDPPTPPSTDIEGLLHMTSELPLELRNRLVHGPIQFVPKFIYVEEEYSSRNCADERVTELLNQYKSNNEMDLYGENKGGGSGAAGGGGGGAGDEDDEQYEEAIPLHGDKLFHTFLTRLKDNPEQILRYSRDEPPLLGAPLPATTPEQSTSICPRCGSRMFTELQLMPAFADILRIHPTLAALEHLHFLSVLVFTCAESCWSAGDTAVKETVVFQPEM